jgi:ankyrin repeat protein
MMNVMSYLSLQDLSSYSQTAKRPNTDCCDYLQLQLELALFPSNSQNHDGINRATTSEISLLIRLASLDFATAEELVDQYRMFVNNTTAQSEASSTKYNNIQKNNPFLRLQQKLHDTWNSDAVVAATTTTMIGLTGMIGATAAAASSCASTYGTAADCTTTFGTACACVSFAAAAVASRYYTGISSTSSTNSNSNNSSSPPSLLLDFIAQKLQALLMTVPQHDEGEGLLPISIANQLRYLRQRYQQDNLTSTNDTSTNTVTTNTTINNSTGSTIFLDDKVRKRKPVGCVGMYNKVLKRAQEFITSFILNKRRTIFSNLTEEEQKRATAAFIDSCASDDEIESLKSLVRNCGVDVNGFFAGSENDNNDQVEAPAATAQSTTTCALHAAAYHGSTAIVKFLCRGVSNKMYGKTTESGTYQDDDEENIDHDDGGLCDVNIVDSNGWSALHFAVGCYSDTGRDVVRILAKYGCNLYHEANNGYTPYHWAQRLSNRAVADELKRLGADARFVVPNNTMELKKKVLMCSAASAAATIPLSIIATRVLHHGNN